MAVIITEVIAQCERCRISEIIDTIDGRIVYCPRKFYLASRAAKEIRCRHCGKKVTIFGHF